VFVRAARADVHPLVRDPAGHGRWWPGVRVTVETGGWVRQVHRPGRLGGSLGVDVRVTSDRQPNKGIHLACRGAFEGRAEWYYLDEVDGTVVHHVLDAVTAERGSRRRLVAYRASVRMALNALKDALERDRPPGEEPRTALLAHQRAVAAELLPPRRPVTRP
jgi:hypothetical protein